MNEDVCFWKTGIIAIFSFIAGIVLTYYNLHQQKEETKRRELRE